MSMQKKHIMRIDIHEDDKVHISVQSYGGHCSECIEEYIKYVIEDLNKILQNIGESKNDNDRTNH